METIVALPTIYVLSDSIGETGEKVVRAAASQFDSGNFDIVRLSYVNSAQQIEEIVKDAAQDKCIICHTMVLPELRAALADQAARYGIPTVDIMGPMINTIQSISGLAPKLKPGIIHALDKEYFKRVEAIEFAVKYDDGKNPAGLTKADVVLVGVSRTSKTPLSMYLAHKSIKVANVPMVPEVPPPEQLFQVPSNRIVGLIIDPYKLTGIRSERLKTMGLATDASYADVRRIMEELEYAKVIMRKLKCTVIDVSNKAIEETANKILEIIRKNNLGG